MKKLLVVVISVLAVILLNAVIFAETEQEFTKEEIAVHNKADDCWVAVKSGVYDISKLLKVRHGGNSLIKNKNSCGQDATELYYSKKHSSKSMEKMEKYRIGRVGNVK